MAAAAPAALRSALPMPRTSATKQVVVKGPDGVRIPPKEFQAGSKTKLKLADSISRRDAMTCLFSALLMTSVSSDAAEARSVKPETRRKIREKLEKLREKAGVPKEKTEPNPKNQDSPSENPEKLTLPLVEASLKQ